MKIQVLALSSILSVMAVCGFSLAQAQQYYGQVQQDSASMNAARNTPSNVMIILDASASMTDMLGNQTKLQVAKDVILNTIRTMPPNVNIGLRVYGHSLGRGGGLSISGPFGGFMTGGEACRQTQLMVPLGTGNRAMIASQLLNIEAVGKTPISYSLRESVQSDFMNAPGKKTIILVSDGRETCAANPCDLTLDMVRAGVDIKINTVGFGIRDRVAVDQLKCIALSTKGKYYSANTAAELAKSLRDSSQVETSVQAKITP